MGPWGTGPFANADAADLVEELVAGDDLTPARGALAATTDRDDWLEMPEGARAVAAAAVVATSFDGYGADLPAEVTAWLTYHPDAATPADARLAMDALVRIGGADSELRELWLAAPEAPAWIEGIARLGYRLAIVVGDETAEAGG
ncbi:MAG: DUF4259 domain-containing protein [Acidimicrobiales bacterium]